MQILSEFIQWAFVPDSHDSKHQHMIHPAFAMVFGCCINLIVSYSASKFLMKFKRFQTDKVPEWGKKYAMKFLCFYMIFMVCARYYALGTAAFYDVLWACNSSIINLILALYLEFPLLIMASLVDVALDQVLWYLDLISFIFTGKFAIGVMKYLTWPQTSWAQVVTGTHHLWFLPLCFILLRKSEKLRFEGFILSAYLVLVFCTLARFLVPKEIIFNSEKSLYLNINAIWDSWKDVKKFYICSVYDSAGTGSLAYFLYVQFFWNTFNFVLFQGFYFIHKKIKYVSIKDKEN